MSSYNWLRKALVPAIGLAAAIGTQTASAEVFAVQGATRSITVNTDGTVTLVCGNMSVLINNNTAVSTPASPITLAQLVSQVPFTASGWNPMTGAPRAGFVGGSCAATGDDTTIPGVRLATDVSVEIEEALLLGARFAGPAYNMAGFPVVLLRDTRMSVVKPATGFYAADGTHPALPNGAIQPPPNVPFTETARNSFGFGVNLSSVRVGDLGAAAGYHGTDGIYYAYDVETTGGNLNLLNPRPSITRTSCKHDTRTNQMDLQVQGGCVIGGTANTMVIAIDGMLPNGSFQTYTSTVSCNFSAEAVPVPNQRMGTYLIKLSGITPTTGACPARIRARSTVATPTAPIRYDFKYVPRV